jgi:hypothetical protein
VENIMIIGKSELFSNFRGTKDKAAFKTSA